MQNKNTEHLTIIQNPNSTNYRRVERQVLQPLREAGVPFEVYTTKYPDAQSNIEAMIADIPDNGTVLSAAGDGTAEQLVNATLAGDKELTLGFLPFGNFNDLASAHMDRGQTVVDMLDAPVVDRYPLSVEINGEHWRDVPTYVTLGLTARIAAGFDDEGSREAMRRASRAKRTVMRLGQAAGDYFRHRSDKLPAFRVNGGPLVERSTDVAIANNPIVAGMIRPRDRYYDSLQFGARADLNMANVFEAASFGTQSLIGRSPLDRYESMRLAFERAATVPVQADGEYAELHNVHDVYVYKDPTKVVRVLHASRNA